MATTTRRKCADCKKALPAKAHPARKYCDRCRPPKKPTKSAAPVLGPVAAATEDAITSAGTDLTPRDAGAVAALRHLAAKIDTEATLREAALKWIALSEDGAAKPPPIDNVSVPTYLKYCESLGLTPAGRGRLVAKPEQPGGQTGGSKNKLTLLSQGVPRPGG